MLRYHTTWLFISLAMAAVAITDPPRAIMYLTGQHNVVPDGHRAAGLTHVILAFMRSEVFNVEDTPSEFPLFTNVETVRKQFDPATKVMVAIGGWGDTEGFEVAARNDSTRQRWTKQVANMVNIVGADGVDIDWEYPGGNRDDYKKVPNSEREWEIEAFVQLLQELRVVLGPNKTISAAVPGKECDLMAFTSSTVPRIVDQVDFLNVMTYDLMNRRDTVTKHHSGILDSREAIERYVKRGAPIGRLNLGLGYYVKWFMTQDCDPEAPLGCQTELLEDPDTGADTGKTGAFSWHDKTPENVAPSFARAQANGNYDEDGSYFYWDPLEKRWWSFDTVQSIKHKFTNVIEPLKLGGVFAWGLGEDAPQFEHFSATMDEWRKIRDKIQESWTRDEL